jgi:hypothetical protein
MRKLTLPGQRAPVRYEPGPGATAQDESKPNTEGARYTLAYGQYRLAYEVYGSGDRAANRLVSGSCNRHGVRACGPSTQVLALGGHQ